MQYALTGVVVIIKLKPYGITTNVFEFNGFGRISAVFFGAVLCTDIKSAGVKSEVFVFLNHKGVIFAVVSCFVVAYNFAVSAYSNNNVV